jgi:hypothetical protein
LLLRRASATRLDCGWRTRAASISDLGVALLLDIGTGTIAAAVR